MSMIPRPTIADHVFQRFKPRPLKRESPKSPQLHLPVELLREIFLYTIEVNQTKSGHLASVCRYWRSVITAMSHLWSTLRVGTWTERERVATWSQRAYPKRVVIDTQGDHQRSPNAQPFVAFQDALASTGEWNELIISSFPPENLAIQPDFQGAMPTIILRTLHVVSECVHAPSSIHMLDLVPIEAPLSALKLHASFASSYFLQPHWFPVLENLTVLVVNGRDIHEPFELLPAFTQLQIFEADQLLLPLYEPDVNLPLLCTLQKLRLRASSVQWMAGREFQCLEECAILLPHHWGPVQRLGVELPSCRKMTYHGYPMTEAQYFRAPRMRAMVLGSHDCMERRVYQQLRDLCRLDGRISKLTMLHLTIQCSEQVFLKVLKYMGPLQELVLSIAYPSLFWQNFLESLAAKPSTTECLDWDERNHHHKQLVQWCSTQTWHANVLPQLKYLGIKRPKGFPKSECIDDCLLLRLVGWTRAQLTPPLEHLKVWVGRGTTDDTVVDYVFTDYLDKFLKNTSAGSDSMIVRGMVTQRLLLQDPPSLLFQLHSTVLFRQLRVLHVGCQYYDSEIPLLPCLEQIKRLQIWRGIIPAYSVDIDLPLVYTLEWFILGDSSSSWMLGRTFKALREFWVYGTLKIIGNQSRHERLQVDLPACTTLRWWFFSVNNLHFLSSPKVQILQLQSPKKEWSIHDEAALMSLRDFLCNCPCLQMLVIGISQCSGLDSLMQFVFCDAREQGVWRDIRNVQVTVCFTGQDWYHFFSHTVENKRHYEKWWKTCTVTRVAYNTVMVKASA